MAHFTGLKELQNHPHKAGFDIGSKNLFTAKIGELPYPNKGEAIHLS